MSPSPTVGRVERLRRERVLQQVLVRMGKESLTYPQAANQVGVASEALRKACAGETTPSPALTAKAEAWLASPMKAPPAPAPAAKSTPAPKMQCAHCPWRKDVVPKRDIPNGYSKDKHCALKSTIARSPEQTLGRTMHVMSCHESPTGAERPCVGWAVNQLGVGNNIGLRLLAMRDERYQNLRTVGPQHQTFEDTLAANDAADEE